MIQFSRHAQARLQQRGIDHAVVEELLNFGCEKYDHRGGRVVYFDRRARKQLQQNLPVREYRRLEARLSVYVVVSDDGAVITAGHRTKRKNTFP